MSVKADGIIILDVCMKFHWPWYLRNSLTHRLNIVDADNEDNVNSDDTERDPYVAFKAATTKS